MKLSLFISSLAIIISLINLSGMAWRSHKQRIINQVDTTPPIVRTFKAHPDVDIRPDCLNYAFASGEVFYRWCAPKTSPGITITMKDENE